MKKINLLIGLVFIGIFSGCTDTAPKCSDDETQKLVIEISKKELIQQAGKSVSDAITLTLSAIRTTDFNEKTGSQECAAQLDITGSEGSDSLDITYKSELTDKGDEFYVTVFGL